MFTKLRDILPKAGDALGMRRIIDASVVCEAFQRIAPQHIHHDALSAVRAKYFRNGILMIEATNAAWAAKILSCADTLMLTINQQLGRQILRKIRTCAAGSRLSDKFDFS